MTEANLTEAVQIPNDVEKNTTEVIFKMTQKTWIHWIAETNPDSFHK